MITPPTNVSEFVVFKASSSSDFEVFLFPCSIKPILDAYEGGHAVDPIIADKVKSFLFEDTDGMAIHSRKILSDWLKQVGVVNPENVANVCASWRLVHIGVPSIAYPPAYQGHPVRLDNWSRMPVTIKKKTQAVKDIFDPLSYILDNTFSETETWR